MVESRVQRYLMRFVLIQTNDQLRIDLKLLKEQGSSRPGTVDDAIVPTGIQTARMIRVHVTQQVNVTTGEGLELVNDDGRVSYVNHCSCFCCLLRLGSFSWFFSRFPVLSGSEYFSLGFGGNAKFYRH